MNHYSNDYRFADRSVFLGLAPRFDNKKGHYLTRLLWDDQGFGETVFLQSIL